MSQTRFLFAAFAALVMAAGLYGCASSTPEQPAPPQPASGEQAIQDTNADTGHHEAAQMWTCSMHPQIQKNKPGKCPMCAMDLIPVKSDKGHGDMHEAHGAMEEMKEGLAELSEEDRAAAEKQHMCPVSGKMLGMMGTPVKLSVKGQDVWICCEDCEETLRGDPDKYLAKLQK